MTTSNDWMQPGAKAEVTGKFGLYRPGDIVYIDEPPGEMGVATVNREPGGADWQFMPANYLKPATD